MDQTTCAEAGRIQRFYIETMDRNLQELIVIVARDEGASMVYPSPWDVRLECSEEDMNRILDALDVVLGSFDVLRLQVMASVMREYGDECAAARFGDEADTAADLEPGSYRGSLRVVRSDPLTGLEQEAEETHGQ